MNSHWARRRYFKAFIDRILNTSRCRLPIYEDLIIAVNGDDQRHALHITQLYAAVGVFLRIKDKAKWDWFVNDGRAMLIRPPRVCVDFFCGSAACCASRVRKLFCNRRKVSSERSRRAASSSAGRLFSITSTVGTDRGCTAELERRVDVEISLSRGFCWALCWAYIKPTEAFGSASSIELTCVCVPNSERTD